MGSTAMSPRRLHHTHQRTQFRVSCCCCSAPPSFVDPLSPHVTGRTNLRHPREALTTRKCSHEPQVSPRRQGEGEMIFALRGNTPVDASHTNSCQRTRPHGTEDSSTETESGHLGRRARTLAVLHASILKVRAVPKSPTTHTSSTNERHERTSRTNEPRVVSRTCS